MNQWYTNGAQLVMAIVIGGVVSAILITAMRGYANDVAPSIVEPTYPSTSLPTETQFAQSDTTVIEFTDGTTGQLV